MSKQQHTISIAPPDYQRVKEKMTFCNYICPVCDGKGSFSEQTGHNEWKTEQCDYCDGSGKVKADVEIKWRPDYE